MFCIFSRRGLAALSILIEWAMRRPEIRDRQKYRLPCLFYFALLNQGRLSVFICMESIGNLIKQELDKQERSISWLARKLSCDRTRVYRILQKHSIDTYDLARISVLLSHDFFIDLSEALRKNNDLLKG